MFRCKRCYVLLGLTFLMTLFVSPFASSYPDGLEWVAAAQGFLHSAEEYVFWKLSVMPDYKIGVIKSPNLSTAIAGTIGAAIAFVTAIVFFRQCLNKQKKIES